MTALPPSVRTVGERALQYKSRPWDPPPSHDAARDAAAVRRLFSQLIGCSGSDCSGSNSSGDGSDVVAIVPSTAFAITMAAHNLNRTGRVRPNTSILLLQDQMPSAVYPWQELCHVVDGLKLVVVPYPTSHDGGWTEQIVRILKDPKTSGCNNNDVSVVCLPQCHWADGSLLDLATISRVCKERNVALVVDATQSIGAHPFSVQDVDADCVACSVHKWLLGPHGASLVYVPQRNYDSWLPLDQHDRARLCNDGDLWDASMNKMHGGSVQRDGAGYPEEFDYGARRLDAGGRPNPILLPMLRAALDIVAEYDIGQVQDQLAAVNEKVLGGARQMGFTTTPGPRAGHILGLRPGTPELKEKLTPEEMIRIGKRLEGRGIFISVRCGAFRISPYLHTTDEEIQQLLIGLADECCDDDDTRAKFVSADQPATRSCLIS
mmetsp:Transcript_27748/g.61733  ORF Transcript_27748/g.61733 Transcript_27748/m.61733 type:complete len:434 (-) Transcript_27748:40-1341(-)